MDYSHAITQYVGVLVLAIGFDRNVDAVYFNMILYLFVFLPLSVVGLLLAPSYISNIYDAGLQLSSTFDWGLYSLICY